MPDPQRLFHRVRQIEQAHPLARAVDDVLRRKAGQCDVGFTHELAVVFDDAFFRGQLGALEVKRARGDE